MAKIPLFLHCGAPRRGAPPRGHMHLFKLLTQYTQYSTRAMGTCLKMFTMPRYSPNSPVIPAYHVCVLAWTVAGNVLVQEGKGHGRQWDTRSKPHNTPPGVAMQRGIFGLLVNLPGSRNKSLTGRT